MFHFFQYNLKMSAILIKYASKFQVQVPLKHLRVVPSNTCMELALWRNHGRNLELLNLTLAAAVC